MDKPLLQALLPLEDESLDWSSMFQAYEPIIECAILKQL